MEVGPVSAAGREIPGLRHIDPSACDAGVRMVLVIRVPNFRRAAEALGISQPALTKSLFQIEREVGQRLFDRHGQTISPTVFGAIVVDTAVSVRCPSTGQNS